MLSHFSRVRLFATPWTVAHQAPLSTEFCRQEYWSGLPARLQGIFLTQGSNQGLLHWQPGSLPLVPPGKHRTGGQDGEDLYGHHDLALGAVVDGEKSDPDTEEHQRAEGQEFGFIEGVRQVRGQQSQGEGPESYGAQVSKDTVEGSDWALVAHSEELLVLRMSVRLKERERDFQQTPQIITWIREHMGMT